jgi:putative phosphoesterase
VPPSGSILRSSLKSTMAFKIGIISDTHGLLRPEAVRRLTGVDHIIHGGDIGRPPVIADLPNIAPVTAIRGNVDKGDWADDADTELVRLAARSIFVVHDLKVLRIDPVASGIDVIVSGHTHVPKIDTVDGVLYLNKSRKRGATAFQVADHACDPRYHVARHAAGHPRPCGRSTRITNRNG